MNIGTVDGPTTFSTVWRVDAGILRRAPGPSATPASGKGGVR
jgi:hypothetical protein